jgi:hypothetical protein
MFNGITGVIIQVDHGIIGFNTDEVILNGIALSTKVHVIEIYSLRKTVNGSVFNL